MIDGIPMKPAYDAAAERGLVAIYEEAEDESVDPQVSFKTVAGKDTDIHIQISGRYYGAREWFERRQAMWFGADRTDFRAAVSDAMARYDSRGAK